MRRGPSTGGFCGGSRGVCRGIAPAGAEKRDPPQGLSVRVEGVPGPWRVAAVRGKGE
jgi:hypothetical protein